MSKHDGRIFLERLVQLRGSYRSIEHEATALTVKDAIAYGIDLLADPDRLDQILGDAPATSEAQGASTSNPA